MSSYYVGKHYNEKEYNCAHYVAQIFKEHMNVEIPTGYVFDRKFVIWMRRNFEQVFKPEDGCLVLMTNIDSSYHVGVYGNYGVYHNFKPEVGNGAVCKWQMSAVKAYYKEVRFYKWSQ